MKTQSLIKAIEKSGIKVEKNVRDFLDYDGIPGQSISYFAKGNRYKVHWHESEGNADCVQVQQLHESNDSMTDYFPGYWANTIKQVIRSLLNE